MVGFDRIDSATRVVNAAPETVFAAFVDPQAIAQWLPPAGATATVGDYEPWAGGSIKLTLTFDEGVDGIRKTSENSDIVEGTFIEIVQAERIVQEFRFLSDDHRFSGVMLMTWVFIRECDGTRVSVSASNVPEGIAREEHEVGMASSLAKLAAYVEKRSSSV